MPVEAGAVRSRRRKWRRRDASEAWLSGCGEWQRKTERGGGERRGRRDLQRAEKNKLTRYALRLSLDMPPFPPAKHSAGKLHRESKRYVGSSLLRLLLGVCAWRGGPRGRTVSRGNARWWRYRCRLGDRDRSHCAGERAAKRKIVMHEPPPLHRKRREALPRVMSAAQVCVEVDLLHPFGATSRAQQHAPRRAHNSSPCPLHTVAWQTQARPRTRAP